MCNIFSGHIISDKSHKDFGKILFISGIHHEKDREEIFKTYGDKIKLVAWESEERLSLDKFKITHSEGDLSDTEKSELLKLVTEWGKNQNKKNLIFEKFLTVLQNNKPLSSDKYSFDAETLTFSTKESNLQIICPELSFCTFTTGSNCTFTTGEDCAFTTGEDCAFTTGEDCTFTTGSNCTFTTGEDCTFTTGSNCTFKTGSNCTFKTGYNCTFKTGEDCTFTTSEDCVVVRRDIYEVIEIKGNIKLRGWRTKGYDEL